MSDENSFLSNTKTKLALRAGYMCSICGKLTVGPSKETDESINLIGEAAHIHSARPKVRRYNKEMEPTERRDINNGIWLCRNHHKNIDSDESEYTVPYLKNIKKNHEKRVDLLNKGINPNSGVITKLIIKNLGLLISPMTIEFGNSTLIFGNNSTGKTLITDFLSSLDDSSKIEKWKGRRNKGSSNVKLEYYDSSTKTYEINYSLRNLVSYSFNNSIVPTILSPFHSFVFKNDFLGEFYDSESVIASLAKYFELKEEELTSLINYLNKQNKEFINEIVIENNELIIMMTTKSPELRFQALSTGEKYRVIIEIGLRLADYYSKHKSVIVILEHTSLGTLDTAGVNSVLKSINNRKKNYQFIFTSYMSKEDFSFEDHTVYELEFTDDLKNEVKITLANNAYN
jgi:hypothetical protein